MKINTRNVKGIPVLDLKGSLVGTDIGGIIAKSAQSTKSNQIVINLSGLDKMDSSGLGELVAVTKELATRGIDSLFVAIPTQLALLRTTKLNAFDDEIDAINSFR